jgi:hypothetical protein
VLAQTGEKVHDLPSFNEFMRINDEIIKEGDAVELAGLIDPDHDAKRLGRLIDPPPSNPKRGHTRSR